MPTEKLLRMSARVRAQRYSQGYVPPCSQYRDDTSDYFLAAPGQDYSLRDIGEKNAESKLILISAPESEPLLHQRS